MIKKLVLEISRYYPIIILGLIIFFGYCQPCFANPIDPRFPYKLRFMTNQVYWLVCPFIEAAIILYFLRHKFATRKSPIIIFILVVLLNWVTMPLTGMLAAEFYLFGKSSYTIYLAEIFPLLSESVVLILLFQIILKRSFSEFISSEVIFLLVLTANLATFIAGLMFF